MQEAESSSIWSKFKIGPPLKANRVSAPNFGFLFVDFTVPRLPEGGVVAVTNK